MTAMADTAPPSPRATARRTTSCSSPTSRVPSTSLPSQVAAARGPPRGHRRRRGHPGRPDARGHGGRACGPRPTRPAWFMDYRNADGSAAEMCGNGSRVFAAYLRREGLETGRRVRRSPRAAEPSGPVRGRRPDRRRPRPLAACRDEADARRRRHRRPACTWTGTSPSPPLSLDLGNPHTVVALPESVDLDGLDLSRRPRGQPRAAAGHQRRVRPAAIGLGHIAHAGPRARGRRDPLLRHGRLRRRPRHAVLGRRGRSGRLDGRRALGGRAGA